jgi:hypothetical protein
LGHFSFFSAKRRRIAEHDGKERGSEREDHSVRLPEDTREPAFLVGSCFHFSHPQRTCVSSLSLHVACTYAILHRETENTFCELNAAWVGVTSLHTAAGLCSCSTTFFQSSHAPTNKIEGWRRITTTSNKCMSLLIDYLHNNRMDQ